MEPQKWNLTDLFPPDNPQAIADAYSKLEAATAAIEALRPTLSPDITAEAFSAVMRALVEFAETATRIGAYGQLWFSEDTLNTTALSFVSRSEQALADASNRVLFLTLWWKSLPEEAAQRLMSGTGDNAYYLYQERLFKDHTLTEPEERIIALKNLHGPNAITRIYDMLTNKYKYHIELEGKQLELTRDALMAYVRHPEASVREAAYREQFKPYAEDSAVLGQIYVHTAMDWASENMTLRKFRSPIAVRNLSNDIPDAVISTLLEVCEQEAPVFHRYFRMKAGWLGSPKLRRFDLYAPIRKKQERRIPYGEAVEMVLQCLGKFSPEASELARRVFDARHIDSEPRARKRGGAFCYGVLPSLTPWVLVNYTGEPRQVATLAHELGHAVHAMLASGHSLLTYNAPLPLAETASVFSEMLLTDALLKAETDPGARRDIIAETVDNVYATVLRQAYFTIFETEAHKAVSEGATIEELSALYGRTLSRQFGDAVEVDEVFHSEWLAIPHMYHTPFYCYAYSFGMLLSLALYRRYQEQGQQAAEGILTILRHGGAQSPADILSEAGVPMHDPEFWRGGFRVVGDMISSLEA